MRSFFFQAEDGIRDIGVTGVQTCALPIFGYMMMGLGIAGLSLNFVDGYTAGFFHLMSHAMFKASLFMGAGALLHGVGSRFMSDMGGLKTNMKKTYVFMLLASLSLRSEEHTSELQSRQYLVC